MKGYYCAQFNHHDYLALTSHNSGESVDEEGKRISGAKGKNKALATVMKVETIKYCIMEDVL